MSTHHLKQQTGNVTITFIGESQNPDPLQSKIEVNTKHGGSVTMQFEDWRHTLKEMKELAEKWEEFVESIPEELE